MKIQKPSQLIALFLVSAFALGLAACQSTRSPEEWRGTYVLDSLGGETFENPPALMRIAGTTVSGRGPVNQWSAELDGNRISQVISSRGSGPEEQMEMERELLSALELGRLKMKEQGVLILVSGGETLARFRAAALD